MTIDEAVELVGTWPKNRSVPRKLSEAILKARGMKRLELGLLTEVLMTASEKDADYELIEKYLS